MPELPDVEALRLRLRRKIAGRRIGRIAILDSRTVRFPAPRLFAQRLRGRKIEGIRRRGKYLLIDVEGGLLLVVHLRMTGGLEVAPRTARVDPHTRIVIGLDGHDLRFVDQRRFGHMDLIPASDLSRLGVGQLGDEPLDPRFTAARFQALLRGRRGALKALLLRQDVIAGIGNIYADEILFRARLHPARRVDRLAPWETAQLYTAVRSVLRWATAALSRGRRSPGAFLAARRRGGICPRCGRPLRAETVAGRATYFCPFDQR